MEYKVLVKIYFPLIEEELELYIPTTKTVKYIIKLLQKAIQENICETYPSNLNATLANKHTGNRYEHNKLIIDTDIRNGSKLILI